MKGIHSVSLAFAAAVFAAEPGDAVREASAQWRQAVIKQDEAALARLLADDLLYAHSNGRTEDKAAYIASVIRGPARYESFKETNTKISVYGNAAVLSGNVEVKLIGREPYRVRTMEVYVKSNGQWQMAAHQSARTSQ